MMQTQKNSSNTDERPTTLHELYEARAESFRFTIIYLNGVRETYNALSLAGTGAYRHPYGVYRGINNAIKDETMEYVGQDTFRVNVDLPKGTVPF